MADQTLHRTVEAAARQGGEAPVVQPPVTRTGIVGWLRGNLFNTWYNSLITLALLYLLLKIVPGMIDWLIFRLRLNVRSTNLK